LVSQHTKPFIQSYADSIKIYTSEKPNQ